MGSEQWRPVVEWEGLYSVSDQGHVRSEARLVPQHSRSGNTFLRHVPERVLSQHCCSIGRARVNLKRMGEHEHALVSHLVAAAYLGVRPDGMHICHNDGNPANNHVTNLRFDTVSGNMRDMLAHGTHTRGSRNASTKLTGRGVLDIRRRHAAGGVTRKQLASEFEVSTAAIRDAISHRNWSWLHDERDLDDFGARRGHPKRCF